MRNSVVGAAARELVVAGHWAEMESLARSLGLPISDIVLCNFYYDTLKVVLGCTAFAVAAAEDVLHARNLDWRTEKSFLGRYTTVRHFVGGPAGEFTTIGWPGFIGAFSGVATGRFAVTLNAVLSLERAVPAGRSLAPHRARGGALVRRSLGNPQRGVAAF